MRAAVTAADVSGAGYLTSEQLEQAMAAAGLKFTRHQVRTMCFGTTASSDRLMAPRTLALQDKYLPRLYVCIVEHCLWPGLCAHCVLYCHACRQ